LNILLVASLDTKDDSDKYRKILISDEEIFNLPNYYTDNIEYTSETLVDENEWYKLSSFSERPYCLNILRSPILSIDFTAFKQQDLGKIEYIFSVFGDIFCFQRITPAKQIKQKMIVFGDILEIENKQSFKPFSKLFNSHVLTIKNLPDAIYHKSNDTLYFRNLNDITKIFVGIDVLFREATETEVINFLGKNFIRLSAGFSSNNVKVQNRRRISAALEILSGLSAMEIKYLSNYIRNYCPNIPFDNGQFIISSESNLKELLYGIEERYYTTTIGEERRLANSYIKR